MRPHDWDDGQPESDHDLLHLDAEWESVICSTCNGSGEGMHEGSTCSSCGGSGEVMVESPPPCTDA
jgi:DnaJ-class molecular chaperone